MTRWAPDNHIQGLSPAERKYHELAVIILSDFSLGMQVNATVGDSRHAFFSLIKAEGRKYFFAYTTLSACALQHKE